MPTKKEEFMTPLADWAGLYFDPHYQERKKMADVCIGQPPLSELEEAFMEVFKGFIEIETTRDILEDMEVYVRRFPFSGTRVTTDRYLSLQIATYLNEVYI